MNPEGSLKKSGWFTKSLVGLLWMTTRKLQKQLPQRAAKVGSHHSCFGILLLPWSPSVEDSFRSVLLLFLTHASSLGLTWVYHLAGSKSHPEAHYSEGPWEIRFELVVSAVKDGLFEGDSAGAEWAHPRFWSHSLWGHQPWRSIDRVISSTINIILIFLY